jgi:hypothetical protein
MKKLIILATILFSVAVTAQAPQGFNYQATARNASGELILNTTIAIQFQLHETTITGPVIYTEAHSVTTNAYGHFTAIVGQGNTTDTFSSISWSTNSHFLDVSIFDISVPGYVNLGTLQLLSVPYALNAKTADNVFSGDYNDLTNQPTNTIVNGLEALDQGNGIGWRLIGRDPNVYSPIGADAVDLSISFAGTGATGDLSVALGLKTMASGDLSVALGDETIASGYSSVTMGTGTMASGYFAVAMGTGTMASGDYAVAMGVNTNANAFSSLAIGSHNIGGGSSDNWVESDPVFEIGIGTGDLDRANALTVLKRGIILAPSFNIDDIQEDKALITKEYADLNLVNSGLETLDEGNGTGWRLTGRDTNNYGNIGFNAIDLSFANSAFDTGAIGEFSIATGSFTTASGPNAIAMGTGTIASGYGAVAMGVDTNANAYTSVALGRYNIGGGDDQNNWFSTDPLFEIGIGTDNTNRANALTILKNGIITAPGFDLNEITDAKALITKEYADANFTNVPPTGLITLDEGNGIGWRLTGRDPSNYGDIGLNAIDLSFSEPNSGNNGARGLNATTMGINTLASGEGSTAMGINTEASGEGSIAMGRNTEAFGYNSIAMGEFSAANGENSFAAGHTTQAIGDFSVAMGVNTRATSFNSFVIGSNNIGGGTTNAWISTDPLFEIGNGITSASNAFTVYKNGNAYLNGTLTQASDLRLKKDIKPLNNSLEKMTQLHGKHYYWNDTKPHSEDLQIGLIAQEVELIFPELVHTANDGYKSVNYTSLIPVLIEAIKEQQNEIEVLKNQNKTLQQDTAKMDALDKKNASLEKRMQKIETLLSLVSKE